jgi:hypothetical protein
VPRQSPEERAASYIRSRGKWPTPPSDMSTPAKRVWNSIVKSRPPDFFAPGSLELLQQFAETTVLARLYTQFLRRDPENREYLRGYALLNGSMSQLSTKLRLAISSSVDKKSGRLDEREPEEGEGKVINLLFGQDRY